MDDRLLLLQYTRDDSEWAFQRIVERHLDVVYAAAFRRVNDSAMAQDVVQVVFLILAKKAKKLPSNVVLSGWLYRTTYFVATKALRSERRRKYHEREAVLMQTLSAAAPDHTWKKLAPFLDELFMRLGEKDRNAVLLRFFEEKDLASVGVALGLSEDAAQKRVSRALEKLRRLIRKRGLTVPGSLLGTTLAAHGTEAPPSINLGQAVILNCLQKGIVTPNAYGLLQESLRQFFWKKMFKTAAALLPVAACVFVLVQRFPADAKETQAAYSGLKNNSGVPPARKVAPLVRAAYQANVVTVSRRGLSATVAQQQNVAPVNSVPNKPVLNNTASPALKNPGTNQLAAASSPSAAKGNIKGPTIMTGGSGGVYLHVNTPVKPVNASNQVAIAIFPTLPQPDPGIASYNFNPPSRGPSPSRAPAMNRRSTPSPGPMNANRRQTF